MQLQIIYTQHGVSLPPSTRFESNSTDYAAKPMAETKGIETRLQRLLHALR